MKETPPRADHGASFTGETSEIDGHACVGSGNWSIVGNARGSALVMGLDLGGIKFYAGPTILGGPDDLDVVARDFIAGAKQRLLIAVQELDSRTIADAVLAAKAAKVHVQLILGGRK